MSIDSKNTFEKKGWLLKWTNYAKGYRRRWFVLSWNILSYYRSEPEAAHTLRGSISISEVLIHAHNDDCTFIISKGELAVFFLKAAESKERESWITALEHAKRYTIFERESVIYNEHHKNAVLNTISIGQNIEILQKCCGSHVARINVYKTKLQTLLDTEATDEIITQQKKAIGELKTSANSVIQLCTKHCNLAEVNYIDLNEMIQEEIKQRKILECLVLEIVTLYRLLEEIETDENLKKLNELRTFCFKVSTGNCFFNNEVHRPSKSVTKRGKRQHTKRISILTTDETDAVGEIEDNTLQVPFDLALPSSCTSSLSSNHQIFLSTERKVFERERRTTIPEKPNNSLHIWSVLKNSIGKDISKIPMPVNFSEPLSFLQRVAEDFAYSNILDNAANCTDPVEELAYLAAFTISTYATTTYRVAKPFNPLLGETFEWDRTADLGWRLISEQVSHHPPISAQFCEGREWTCWQEFGMASKFRGKYLQITPLGISHVEFKKSGNRYCWKKATTIIYNIIIGKLWVDQQGDVDIINIHNDSKCQLSYVPYSMFKSDEQRKVTGRLVDSNGEVTCFISGKWDTEVSIKPVISKSGKPENPTYKTGPNRVLWKAEKLEPDREKYYNFDHFACQLNEMEPNIAPTDSRNRPDQRLMEDGNWDEANIKKLELEARQRSRRHRSDSIQTPEGSLVSEQENASVAEHEPIWFTTEMDPRNGRLTYVYKGGYWEAKAAQDWARCPNIF